MRFSIIAFVFAAASFLVGCAHYETKDHATFCGNSGMVQFQRTIHAKNGQGIIKTTFKVVPEISNGDNPIDAQTFWIRLAGFTEGRKSFNRGHWESGDDGIPMLYSTEYTYVELEDGTRISAEPDIYFSGRYDPDRPGAAIGSKTVDLNADAIQLTKNNGFYMYGYVYIKFNTPPPLPTSHWKVHLGQIVLGNELTEIPERDICLAKGYSATVWGHFFP